MKNNLFFYILGFILLSACANQSNKVDSATISLNDSSAAINAINKADSLWDDQSAHNSVQGWLSFYTDDAIMMPPGEKVCKDNASREASIKNMFAIPGANLRFQATKTEVSKSLDLGYSAGVYQFNYKDATGKQVHETGKFCETWKKQSDGNWKCIVDIWNADSAN